MSTPDLNWNLERNKQNPLHDHEGPFASPGLVEAEVTCSNIWLLQEIQVILFNDLKLEMYCSFHLSLAISVEHWTGLEMKLKNNRIMASQDGGKDIWGKGGIGSCYHPPWSLWMRQNGFGTASSAGWVGVTLKCGTEPTFNSWKQNVDVNGAHSLTCHTSRGLLGLRTPAGCFQEFVVFLS